jgi:predicted dehydrogenase
MSLTASLAGLDEAGEPLAAHLRRCGLEVERGLAGDVVVLAPDRTSVEERERVLALDRPVLLLLRTADAALHEAAGLLVQGVTPRHEVRLRPGPDAGETTDRLDDPLLVQAGVPLVDKAVDDVEVLLTANVAWHDHPVATWRPSTGVGALVLDVDPAEPVLHLLVHRLVRHLAGLRSGPPVRVGMLGYGGIGHEHASALSRTTGLSLVAVCDRDPARVEAARAWAPELRGLTDGDALLADDDVDLVVVSTPPSSHAEWVLRALEAGKHVVVEKPFCLTVEEADRQVAAAAERGLLLAVYQNRRWDADYLALKRVVRSGRIGEVFHYESFVGGYGHPCNFWHSDEAISGGAIYDWGSHYLDWVLDLLGTDVAWVSSTAHKRVWHDVTNADHSRVLLHYADGTEAEFTHSDLAAARKPKFYVLGTHGGRSSATGARTSVVGRSPVGLLTEDRLAPADAPAALRVLTPDGAGGTSETALSLPPPPPTRSTASSPTPCCPARR